MHHNSAYYKLAASSYGRCILVCFCPPEEKNQAIQAGGGEYNPP